MRKDTAWELIVIAFLFGVIMGNIITLFSSYDKYKECTDANKEYVRLME